MWSFNMIAFLIYPYLVLTIFVVGHTYRYMSDPFRWNSRSSELLDKGELENTDSHLSLGNYCHVFRAFLRIADSSVAPRPIRNNSPDP